MPDFTKMEAQAQAAHRLEEAITYYWKVIYPELTCDDIRDDLNEILDRLTDHN